MISDLTQQSWDKKTIELGGSILQAWAWGEFQKSLGEKIHRFSGSDFVNLAIENSLPFGKKYLYCPRGPLGNTEAALIDLKQLEKNHTIVFSRIEPLNSVALTPAAKNPQPLNEWVLNLEKSEDEILIQMKPKTRYNINLAQRKGVVVREGDQKDLLALWQLFLVTSQRNGFRLHPQNYYLQMWDHLFPHNLRLLIAEYKGQPLAGMLLTLFGDTATYLHGGSSSNLKEAMAPYLLHWEAIRLSKRLGFKLYDFGGIAPSLASTSDASRGGPRNDERHAWAGISRFKKSFGGFEVAYPGAYDLIYSPIWYTMYKQSRTLRKLIR